MAMQSPLLRLKQDFQLSIICLMGLLAVFGITPYAIYRLSEGNYSVAALDCLVVASAVWAVRYAWLTGNTKRPGIYLAVILSLCATMITLRLGVNGLFWVYPLIVFNFFMAPPMLALGTMLMVLSVLTVHDFLVPGSVADSRYQLLSFLVTSAMASCLTFIFAQRTRSQHVQLKKWANFDALTGARNRRSMTLELERAVRQQKNGQEWGVLLMDLDHFKVINDTHGHQVGDQVLQDFAALVRQNSRREDALYRLGGEEFLLLLPGVNDHSLRKVGEHLVSEVNKQLRSPGGTVSVSIGGAKLLEGEDWETWLSRADQYLYQAKRSGRNRYAMAETD